MATKQIIIDRVDVSGCIYFKMNNKTPMCRACNSGVGSPYCEYHKDCYYKQLKEKEKECEELKKELQAQRAFTAHEQKLIYCVAYDESCKTGNDCKQKKCIFKDNIKLKQTLTEIKEIAEPFCDACQEFEPEKNKICMYCNYGKILQKIRECEV